MLDQRAAATQSQAATTPLEVYARSSAAVQPGFIALMLLVGLVGAVTFFASDPRWHPEVRLLGVALSSLSVLALVVRGAILSALRQAREETR